MTKFKDQFLRNQTPNLTNNYGNVFFSKIKFSAKISQLHLKNRHFGFYDFFFLKSRGILR